MKTFKFNRKWSEADGAQSSLNQFYTFFNANGTQPYFWAVNENLKYVLHIAFNIRLRID